MREREGKGRDEGESLSNQVKFASAMVTSVYKLPVRVCESAGMCVTVFVSVLQLELQTVLSPYLPLHARLSFTFIAHRTTAAG